MRAAILALLLCAAPAAAEGPALLRPHAVVEEPVLRLGALFEGLAPERAARPIGAAPEPGRRLVLEAGQLAALARAHGVAWRPLSPREQAMVERPGRPLARAEIEEVLRAELLPLGLDAEAALELGGLLPPLVPPGVPVLLAAEGASYDTAGHRFAATLVIGAEGMAVQRLRVAGRAVATVPAVVATRRLALGEVLAPADVRPVRLRAELARPGMAALPEQVVGKELRRPIGADVPVLLADATPPVLVARNAAVILVLEAPGMQLTARGRALEAGGRGAVVRVANLISGSVVEAVVIGPGRVRVTPGSGPVALVAGR
jgi:flagella basal body P-ring formation protein FlgA